MKICFIADLHLPYHPRAVQYEVFDWALRDLREQGADALVFAGDFTADGHPDAFRAFAEKLRGLDIPVFAMPGNADYRTPETAACADAYVRPTPAALGETKLLLLFDGRGEIAEETYARLETADENTVVCGHHPPESLPEPHRTRMLAWERTHPQTPAFFAHLHAVTRRGECGWLLPAADPDKNIGEEPAIAYYDTQTRTLRQSFFRCPVPPDFAERLALSCRREEDIRYAAERGLSCIELRGELLHDPETVLPPVSQWRAAGGTLLSLHAPELVAGGRFRAEEWDAFADFAGRVSAGRVTLHVPDIPADAASDGRLAEIAGFAAEKIAALPDSLVIGVENMHMTAKDTPERRRFGYLPDECLRFMRILRAHTAKKTGIHLDVGHARNNAPFQQRYTLSAWYAETGAEIVGYHIHQVKIAGGKLENHLPIDDWYGKYISYAGFFRAWETGMLAKAPVILEIRPEGGYRETFALLDRERP